MKKYKQPFCEQPFCKFFAKIPLKMVERRENFSILEALKTSYSVFKNVLYSFKICTINIKGAMARPWLPLNCGPCFHCTIII